MKDKPSEWIAISDLMAGVMAVVMLLLVLSVMQKRTNELLYQEEKAKYKDGKNIAIEKVMQTIQGEIHKHGAEKLMALNRSTNRLTLRDSVFERGSACLTPQAHAAVKTVQQPLVNFLKSKGARIYVEGYTDNVPVKHPVTDYQRFCTVYDDNFTLSAARAREARRALIGTLNDKDAQRIVVAGYGDSRPLENDPADPKNRRVEVQFVIDFEK